MLAVKLLLTLILDWILTKTIGRSSHNIVLINLINSRQVTMFVSIDKCACL